MDQGVFNGIFSLFAGKAYAIFALLFGFTIIGAAIYFPFGLYLASYCGYTVSLLIGLFTFFLQVLFCKWWLGRHKQEPLEYIWHRWTWIGTDK